jgi:hypothetical protein
MVVAEVPKEQPGLHLRVRLVMVTVVAVAAFGVQSTSSLCAVGPRELRLGHGESVVPYPLLRYNHNPKTQS